MSEPRESGLGRLLLGVVLGVTFAGPLWLMITAGFMQLFPELVGASLVVRDGGIVAVEHDLRSWAIGGTVSFVLVGGVLGVLSLGGALAWLAERVRHALGWDRERRYEELAGTGAMPDVTLRSTSHPSAGGAPTEGRQ